MSRFTRVAVFVVGLMALVPAMAHAQASIVESRESVSIGKKSAANRRLRRHSNAGELRGESSWTANEPEKK